MDRAAIYVRVSTDYDSQRDSPQHQLAACQEYAQSIGLETNHQLVYNDAGLTGTEMEHRAEVQRLLADARNGKFEAVLFTAISRFSRDMADAFNMKKKLESVYGVRIVSIEEGYDTAIEGRNNEMVFTVHAMLAAHKSKEMSVAIRRGLRQSAKKGRHIGNVTPYGYIKSVDKKLQPDPQTAPIVQDIFRMYLSGMGSKSIADNLNKRGIPTASRQRRNKPISWQASTVNAILHNQVYVGTILAHRWTMMRDTEFSRRKDKTIKRPVLRNESEWIVIEHAHEAIIDFETFQRAQELLQRKAKNRGIKRTANLLSGCMKCAECEGAMIVTSSTGASRQAENRVYKYIVCAKTRRIGKFACINHAVTNYEDFLEEIFASLKRVPLSEEFSKRIKKEILQQTTYLNLAERMAQLSAALQMNQTEQLENLRAFRQGLFSEEIIRQGQQELEERAIQLQSEILRLRCEEKHQASVRDQLSRLDSVENIYGYLEVCDEMTKRMTLQLLIDHIDFHKSGDIDVYWSWRAAT